MTIVTTLLLLVAMATSCNGGPETPAPSNVHSTLRQRGASQNLGSEHGRQTHSQTRSNPGVQPNNQANADPDTHQNNDQVMSLVLDPDSSTTNFIRVLDKPNYIGHQNKILVEYLCQMSGYAGLELRVWNSIYKNHTVFRDTWSCSPFVTSPLRHKVLVRLPDAFAYKPSLINTNAQTAQKLVILVYLLEDGEFHKKKGRSRYEVSTIKSMYRTKLLPPFQRSSRPIRECLTWWTRLATKLTYAPKCPPEPVEYKLLKFPMALSQGKSGVHRVIAKHRDPVLERLRLDARADAQFTFVVWLYIAEWCPPGGPLCSILQHLTWEDYYMTPLIFMNSKGNLHIQIATQDSRPMAFLTNDFYLPRKEWFRLGIRCKNQKFEIDVLHGPNHSKKFHTWYRFGTADTVFFDHASGVFALGGTEMNRAFKGFIGEAAYYREYVNLNTLKIPDPYHPMYELKVNERLDKCQTFSSWIKYRTHQCQQRLKVKLVKNSCTNDLEQIFGVTFSKTFPIAQCYPDLGPSYAHYRHVNKLIRRWVYRRIDFTEMDIGQQLYKDAKSLIEEKGLDKSPNIAPLLRQASCHGNHDASFMLGAIFSKGVAVKADEMLALSYLMQGALANHRLCLMSLGNKHAHGLDGAPQDLEIAYAYYKHVGDMTKGDRDKHLERDVIVEQVRLTDEERLEEQTQEDGDLFQWFKYQASQGVISAQQNLGRLLFWGTQGVRRDLRQAAEFYRMGAENGDAQSMHDYGIVLLKGQGAEKNETLAKDWLEKAAKKGHVNAHNALGWFALEREKNYTLALKYFHYAHERGNPDAAYNIGHMLQYGRLDNHTVDKIHCFPYFAAGAARGQLDAALMVAQTNQRGHPLADRDTYIALDWARFVSEQNPAVGIVLHKGLKAYQDMNWPAALLYYIMAAESGIEVGNFNLAYLCEQNVEGVVTQLQKECVYTHYNLTTKRYPHQVDPYAWIKMGDYYWHGLGGEQSTVKAANAYCEAALRWDPHAVYNLGFMIEEGAEVPVSVWYRLNIAPEVYHHNASLLSELYYRCSESYKSEAYIPCILSLYRVQITDIWTRYHLLLKLSTVVAVVFATLAFIPSVNSYLHANRAATEAVAV